jgi:uncharacterized protein with NRDE domain
MCTVSFIPTGKDSYILTSNRDENVERSKAFPPKKFTINGNTVFYPVDGEKGGTWIVTGGDHYSLCLLNGAFRPHIRKSSYKHSRGKILTDFFKYKDHLDFIEKYEFEGLEPFTLIIIKSYPDNQLLELRWDESDLHIRELDASEPEIWSSSTLYSSEIIQKREAWFQSWLKTNPELSTKSLVAFHQFTGEGNKDFDLVMNRGFLRTVSITSIEKKEKRHMMYYHDLLSCVEHNFALIG